MLSLRGILVAVACVAICCVAVANPGSAWAFAFECATAFLFLLALLGVIYRRHEKQAFWVGILAFGVPCTVACWTVPETSERLMTVVTDKYVPMPNAVRADLELEREVLRQQLASFAKTVDGPPSRFSHYTGMEKRLKAMDQQLSTASAAREVANIVNSLIPLYAAFAGSLIGFWFYRTSPGRQAVKKN